MNRKQISRATLAILNARLNYLEALGDGRTFNAMAEYDAIREELDARSNAVLDAIGKQIDAGDTELFFNGGVK